jgi:A/G-specific adenine glycosylase
LRAAVLDSFAARGRDLAFRATTDPYAILVSEAMAQQTQAVRAAEYWTRFMAEFPTVQALASATPAAVLRAWRGLGYNRRALALRKAAIAILTDHGGRVPDDLEALVRLPGVGPYTARAVAALAFGRPVGAVDVNVRRVLSRAIGGSIDAFGAAELQRIADASVPLEAPGTWTHAVMDIGATFCRPRAPRCAGCPAAPWCRYALASGRDAASGNHGSTGPRMTRERPARFETTSRWLRGRLLDLLRDAPGDAWATIPTSMGGHDAGSLTIALDALVRDGLAQRHPTDRRRARLPIA